MEETEFLNLTPHEITIVGRDGKVKKIPPSGLIARVAVKQEEVGKVGDIPIVRTIFGGVILVDEKGEEIDFNMHPETNKCNNCKDQGLCDIPARYHSISDCEFQDPRKYFIVSSMVAQAISREDRRNDILSPDTSPGGVVRDKEGRIIGVKRFQRW